MPIPLPPSLSLPRVHVLELQASDEDLLQRFYERNPLYFEQVNGAPPRPDEAREEIRDLPPEGWSFSAKRLLGYADDQGELVAMASLVSDLMAPRVWLVGLFIVATELHGSPAAREIYAELERWMRRRGAAWVRLGVVVGNDRAERFWERQGFAEVRRRDGISMGQRVNSLRVMVKPLDGGRIADYLEMVPRDRPGEA
ncbi:Acetyltransferase (GNAT) family protein [Mitsuaria sp. PDC51]|jgi:GNAT superfamily N-acetyltransferase|uniref:GNAT family N-acetyltransferase n=1 Tax=unclassified Roseateles TaxID=2626991 RepID=UPI0008E01579|nr:MULTISPECIES: GNAT family N-acetyltransferase [unclassified Roseateles]MBB3292667.1 GNAT superfamily N-acetyltransferase [Mitsuaria sp. BK041]MBB3361884.1 GNAT superfamily N-acetyltransferase [Mitsuaria sp. BK045]SFR76558.1 Acetyltransferase (GNAT) family protein [Mitsuaria sp. PDC51]